jgi:hypothetical protein
VKSPVQLYLRVRLPDGTYPTLRPPSQRMAAYARIMQFTLDEPLNSQVLPTISGIESKKSVFGSVANMRQIERKPNLVNKLN